MDKSDDAFRTIGEAAEELGVPQHVLRFWETRFAQIKPMKRGGGRRYYRPADMALLHAIHGLLYGQGYTIKGVQRLLKERGSRGIAAGADPQPQDDAPRTSSDRSDSRDATGAEPLRAALADLLEARRVLVAAR